MRRLGANLFIVFFAYSAAVMAIPWPVGRSVESALIRPVLPLVSSLGLWHRLQLFSPEPPHFTGTVAFEVAYRDGTAQDWVYPRGVMLPGDPPGSFNRTLFTYCCWGFGEERLADLCRYVVGQQGFLQTSEVRVVQRVRAIDLPRQSLGALRENVIYSYDVVRGQGHTVEPVLVW